MINTKTNWYNSTGDFKAKSPFAGGNENIFRYMSPLVVDAITQVADPFVSGMGFLMFLYVPKQVREITNFDYDFRRNDAGEIEVSKSEVSNPQYFNFLEKTYKGVDGIQNIELDTVALSGGATNMEIDYPSIARFDMKELTIKYQELSGGVYRKPLMRWLTSIVDYRTGLSTLDQKMKRFYTVDAIYINCASNVQSPKASVRKSTIEDAFFLTGLFPKVAPMDFLNYQAGTKDIADLDIRFSVNSYFGAGVNYLAEKIVGSEGFYKEYIQSAQMIGSSELSRPGADLSLIKRFGIEEDDFNKFKVDSANAKTMYSPLLKDFVENNIAE